MIKSKFILGQQIRHKIFGYIGLIIDVDSKFSLKLPNFNQILKKNYLLINKPWYHVVMKINKKKPIYTYLSENQISYDFFFLKSKKKNINYKN